MLALTHPENWTPHACRAATRIFVSNMKPPQAQLFLEVVLLDAIRDDIAQNKKLNPQYYECLKRALYKPSAFFKGLIFPMLDVCCVSVYATHLIDLALVRLHIEGSSNHSLCFGEKKGSRPPFLCRPHSDSGDGIYG